MRRTGFRMKRSTLDPHAADELDQYIENTGELYNQKKSILANLQRKAKKGIYDKTKAAKLWEYWVTRGAQQYRKEFGGGPETFNKATREHVATELATRYPEGRE